MYRQPLSLLAKSLGHTLSSEDLIQGFAIDSRLIQPGAVFVALKGERVDGHTFLKEVADKGAIAAIVSEDYAGEEVGIPLLRVVDPLLALQDLARELVASRGVRVVAVTGSVGKTTTKEFVASLLEERYRICKTLGNANSQVGVPLTILNSACDEEVLVLEMGMSQAGQIQTLVQIAPPEVAVITCVGWAHAAFFDNGIEGIAAAKAEIFSHPKTRLGVVPADAARFASVLRSGSCKKVLFPSADYSLERVSGGVVICSGEERTAPFKLPFEAKHLVEDFLAAVAVARAMDVSWEAICQKAERLTLFKRRFETVERAGVIYLNDSYNASPESMRAALQNLPKTASGGKKIAVLGEMKELGPFSERSHQEVGQLALSTVDHLLCFGQGCSPMVSLFSDAGRPVHLFTDFTQLRERLAALVQPGDVVLIKGSNSNGLWRLLE